MEEDIKILEELIKNANIENADMNDCFYGEHIEAIEHLIKAYKELEEENEKLKSDNLEYQRTQDIFDERTYRKKYLEERRKEEPNLLYPDSDEIYKRYYKLKEENKELKKDNKRYEKELHDVIEFSIPVSLVEEKIEELKEEIEQLRIESNITYDSGIYRNQIKIDILQELLERRK